MDDSIIQESLGELVANQLRKSIWNKELKLGERLIENNLAEKYGVSRSTIRDALKILEYEEMVTIKQRKGTYVSKLSQKDSLEIIELRIMVESYAFVKALPYLTDQHFEYLENILDKMKQKVEVKNWNDLFNLDIQFHKYIVDLSNNSRVIKIYDSMQTQIRTYLLYLDDIYSGYDSFFYEQKELLDALRSKDPNIVDKEIRKHIAYVEEKFIVDS